MGSIYFAFSIAGAGIQPPTALTNQRDSGQEKGWRFVVESFGVSCNLSGAQQLEETQHKDHKHCTQQRPEGRDGQPHKPKRMRVLQESPSYWSQDL